MPKADPLSPVRRERFQTYCIAKGWRSEGGRWRVADIAAATKKAVQKVSDLLNGHSTFGAKIAREIEDALHLPGGYFDNLSGEDSWPFPGIPPVRFMALTRDQQIEIQGLVRERIEKFESPSGEKSKSQPGIDKAA